MAENQIDISVNLIAEKALASLQAIEKQVKNADTGFDKLGKTVTFLNQGFQIVSSAVSKLVASFDESIKAAIDQENAINELNVALKGAGVTSKLISQEIQIFASELSKTTTFADEVTTSAAAMYITLTKSTVGVKEATIAAQNLSAQFGIDLNEAMRKIVKSGEDGGLALKKMGIEIQKGATDSETLANAISKINGELSGVAASKINTYEGAIKQAKNAWGELLENIGNYIIKNPLIIETIKTTTAAFLKLAEAMQSTAQDAMVMSQDELRKSLKATEEEIAKVEKTLEDLQQLSEEGLINTNQVDGLTQQLDVLLLKHQAYEDQLTIIQEDKEAEREGKRDAAKEKRISKINEEILMLQEASKNSTLSEQDQIIAMDLFKVEQKLKTETDLTKIIELEEQKRDLIKQKNAEADKKRTDLEFKQKLQSTAQGLGALAALAQAGGEKSFGLWKAMASAQAIVSGYLAVINALATGGPFPFNIVAASAVGTMAALQVRNIQMSEPPKYQDGGIIGGSSYVGDSQIARVNSGEMILNRDSQQALFNNLSSGGMGGTTINVNINGNLINDDENVTSLAQKLSDAVRFRNVDLVASTVGV
jgi:hypothetical protein